MDWTSIAAPLIRAGLPILGNIFLPGIGGQLGGAIGNAIAGALGVEPTPEAVKAVVETQPDFAKSRLAELESERRADIDRMRIQADEMANVRGMQIVAVQSHHWTVAVPVAVTAGIFIFLVGVMISVGLGVIKEDGIALNGAMNFWMAAIGYWLGSSLGSRDKTSTISNIATSSTTPSPSRLAEKVIDDAADDKRR